ncbi:MAG: TIGR01906 family membrane protein [Anaerolineales bacterium]
MNLLTTFMLRSFKLSIILSLPLLLVLGSVRLLLTDQYLAFEYGKTGFPADRFGFDADQRLDYAVANFRYVREQQPLNALADQRLENTPLYNDRELTHMQDVQTVYQMVWKVWQLALGLTVLAGWGLAWRAETRPALTDAIKWGGLLTAGIVLIVGSLAVVAWQVWFVAFHEIFFASGTWTFNYSDTLIRLFPEKFWVDATLTIASLSLIGGLLLALTGWRYRFQPPSEPARFRQTLKHC